LVKSGQAHEEAFRALIPAEERERVGTAEQWAPKEVIAHLGFWKHSQMERLAAEARGETLQDSRDYQTINTESWPEHARLTWDESVARSDASTRALIATLEAIPPETLASDDKDAANRLMSLTLGNTTEHVAAHMSDFFLSLGDVEGAKRVNQTLLDEAISANLGPVVEGSARYNQGCFYALNGFVDEALGSLRQAFALRPDLIDWARQDTDLNNLRANPAFQALVPPAPVEGA
jgi:hypothetical protein